jgi:uncharacterized YigZ family protein
VSTTDDIYYTITRESSAEVKRKGSRFIAEALDTPSAESAEQKLAAVRKREHAANHHCFAWRVGLEDAIEYKYSDDGEPLGTAGKPIYDALCGRELTNTLVVVTRYFGGTRLGTGGLVRAYSDSAVAALDKAGRQKNYILRYLRVTIDFPLYDQIMKLLAQYDARQTDAEFTSNVVMVIEARRSQVAGLREDLVQISAGRATIEELDQPRQN